MKRGGWAMGCPSAGGTPTVHPRFTRRVRSAKFQRLAEIAPGAKNTDDQAFRERGSIADAAAFHAVGFHAISGMAFFAHTLQNLSFCMRMMQYRVDTPFGDGTGFHACLASPINGEPRKKGVRCFTGLSRKSMRGCGVD